MLQEPSLKGELVVKIDEANSVLYFWDQRSADLGGPEAEGGGCGVGLLPVLQHQPTVLGQGQVVAGGQVAQSEGLTPADVAAAPAEHKSAHVLVTWL